MDIKNAVNTAAGKLGTFTKTAVKKTGEAAETAKLNLALISEKRKLEKMFATLGKLFYEQAKGTDVRIQIRVQVFEIDEQKSVIASLRREIIASKGKAVCAFCGKPMEMEATYCNHCGKQQFVKNYGCEENGCGCNEETADEVTEAEDFVDAFKDVNDKYFS